MIVLMLIIGLVLGFLLALAVLGVFSRPKEVGVVRRHGKYYVTLVREVQWERWNMAFAMESLIADPGRELSMSMLKCFDLTRSEMRVYEYPFKERSTAAIFAEGFQQEIERMMKPRP